ncbi:hypothetical protein RND71_038875 [Anisodus tanguticus]|uniref:Uncharacterized protein n=1 Tax=Anisodus tanguticus TaxID=243964 RepID=A0AAE1UZJ7_9SOLA|nr:hypothetical protein RND71_038875 [Anisodus tanguticus]
MLDSAQRIRVTCLVLVTFEAGLKRPCLVPELENQGICISLACGDRNDDIVASFRPKLEISGDMVASQVCPTPVSTMDQAVEGSHRRMGSRYQKLGASCAKVGGIQLPKSAIIDRGKKNPVFASGYACLHNSGLLGHPSVSQVAKHFSYSGICHLS